MDRTMRTIFALTAMLVLLAGCSRAKPKAPVAQAPPVAIPEGSAPAPEVTPPEFDLSRPRPAAQWATLLDSGDANSRDAASRALRDLGKAGFPYLLQGMRHRSWEVRMVSLRAASKQDMVANRSQAYPVLTTLAQDSNPEIAHYAIIRLGWLGGAGRAALPILKKRLEDHPEAKDDTLQAIIDMHDSVPALATLLGDPDRILRKQAAIRLLGMGRNGYRIDAAGTVLNDHAKNDDDPEVRIVAAEAAKLARAR
jgi:HEAT repeat protein